MSKARSNFAFLTWLAAAALFLIAVLYLFGWLFKPSQSGTQVHDEETLIEAKASRDASFDLENLPVIYRNVDYSEGESGEWFPKGEAPLLAELSRDGILDPVALRTGSEPVVLEGVDGIGNYGGTWYRVATSETDMDVVIAARLSGTTLIGWSPMGYPLVPRLAREWEASEDGREFVFHLRKGLRWSDGHPFTADDILYWWENEVKHFGLRPRFMQVRGELGEIEKVDSHTIRVRFPHPNSIFPESMARFPIWSPRHYLEPFHPEFGEPERIEAMLRAQGVPNARTAYYRLRDPRNPAHPRLWPWVPRSFQRTPPFEFLRNPYYWAVDTRGNQLPYVDRVLFDLRSEGMIPVTAASGAITMQFRHIRYADYTLYMDQREANGYQVYHWFQTARSAFCVFPNLNLRIDPERPETAWKHRFLNKAKFRQALSLALNRAEIITAEFNDQTEPAQLDPGPESPFHHPRLFHAFTEHDPERANLLLDEIGLDRRDARGFRLFPDGTPMTWYLHSTDYTGAGPANFLIEHWANVGVRVILQERARSLWQRTQLSMAQDFTVWAGESEFLPLIEPRSFVPTNPGSFFAPGFANWYMLGGLHGNPEADRQPRAIAPPPDHPLRHAMELYDLAIETNEDDRREAVFREVLDIAADNLWSINVSTPPPQLVIVKDGFRNVPRNAAVGYVFETPANTGIETYFFENPSDSPGALAQMKADLAEFRPNPEFSDAFSGTRRPHPADAFIRFLLAAIAITGGILIAVRHPFIGRRLLVLVPTCLIISVGTFIIIQLPPDDFMTYRILELEMAGDDAALQQIEELKGMFHLDESGFVQYIRWMGFPWFLSFDPADRGLLQGSLGRSMEHTRKVNDLVGDRILLTFLISILTIIFTWALAIPIGVYSAVRQYSVGDYFFTLLGFLGMCIPNFLLALILMYLSSRFFGVNISGLFSPEYAAQPEWTWGKFMDLLKHIWVPVVVLGTGGTAWMIRVMRGNLLDELRKPYVVTARAKGVRPMKLLLKYPVRIALNPFVSGLGSIFPQLVSGGAIVAIVLSLPTVGPLLLNSLMAQDMYLAGSLLMVLSLLTVFGTLVSDLLLMWLDPRIRLGGGVG